MLLTILLVCVALVVGFFAVALLIGWLISAEPYRGSQSDHFDGRRFHNLVSTEHGAREFFRWRLHREKGSWPQWTESPRAPRPPDEVNDGGVRVTFVNHSTLLIQMDGHNILTDPVWSDRVSPFSWIGPKRHRPPGLHFEELPRIDTVLLSHNHYDHLDLPTLRRLVRDHNPRIFAPLGNRQYLEARGIESIDCEWWQEEQISERILLVTTPAQHFSSRGIADRNATLWCGYMLAGAAGRIYFAGDSGMGPHFEMIASRFAPIRLSFLPIGAYRPEWFMCPVHMSPKEAVQAHGILRAQTSIPIHFGTFFLGDDGQDEPLENLERAIREAHDPRIVPLLNGEVWDGG